MNELNRARGKVRAGQRAVDKLDAALAKDIAKAYQAARRDLLADLTDAFMRLGDEPTPAQIRGLLAQRGLIQAIERRLAELGQDVVLALDKTLRDVTAVSLESVMAEIELLAAAVGVDLALPFALDPLLELTVGPAVAQVPSLTTAVAAQLTSQLRIALAQGERMAEITKALYGTDSSIFSRGLTSARLMTHRAVTEAENTARLAYLEAEQERIPALQKQAIAKIDASTSKTCLDLHGQIQPLDKPFEVRGGFGDRMTAPFHWGPCRTTVAGYHPLFEQSSSLTTASLRAEAAAEVESRE